MCGGCTVRGAVQGPCSRSWMCLAHTTMFWAASLLQSLLQAMSSQWEILHLPSPRGAEGILLSLDALRESCTSLFVKPDGLCRATKLTPTRWGQGAPACCGFGSALVQAPLGLASHVPKLPFSFSSLTGVFLLKHRLPLQQEGKLDSPGSWIWQMQVPNRGPASPPARGSASTETLTFSGGLVLPTNMKTSLLCPGSLSDAFHGVGENLSALTSGQKTQMETPPIRSGCIGCTWGQRWCRAEGAFGAAPCPPCAP